MKIILTINHTQILLPDDQGLSTLLKVLGRGLVCCDWRKEIRVTDQVPVEIKTVPAGRRIVKVSDLYADEREQPKPLALPEPKSILL